MISMIYVKELSHGCLNLWPDLFISVLAAGGVRNDEQPFPTHPTRHHFADVCWYAEWFSAAMESPV